MPDSTTHPERSSGASFKAEVNHDKLKRESGTSLKSLGQIWPFVARYPAKLGLFLLFLALSAMATLLLPNLLKLIIDCGFGESPQTEAFCGRVSKGDAGGLTPYFQLAFVFVLAFSMFGSLRYYFITSLGQRVVADLRQAVYDLSLIHI